MRAFVVAALLVAAPAYADDDPEYKPPAPTSVRGHLDGSTAHFVARYSIPIAKKYLPGAVSLVYPSEGVVTGATATVFGKSHRMTFATNEASQAAFDKLLTADDPDPHGWMIRLSGGSGTLEIDIASARVGTLVLEVEISVPSCFYRDVRYVALPKEWNTASEPTLRHGTRAPDLEVAAECSPNIDHESVQWVGFASAELAARPAGDSRIDGIAMRLPLGDRDFARVELDLSREISAVPADLHTAIVIDNSRSVTQGEAEVQRAIVASYLRRAPQTHVQVIAFSHNARALLPGWTAAAQAAPRIDREIGALAHRNGSDVDVALAAAAVWLGRVEGTKRILLFTDQRLAQRLLDAKPAALRALIPAGTLVHVVALGEDEGPLERADDVLLAGLARETEGIAVRGRLDDKAHVDATMLVRPISLDHAKINAPGWEAFGSRDAIECGIEDAESAPLKEGQSCTWIGQGTATSGPVMLEGFLWGRRFTRIMRPDPSQARALARVLTVVGGFDQEVQRRIDQLAFAVNAVWSLSATSGDPRGYKSDGQLGGGTSGFGTCGGDRGISDGFGFAGGFAQEFDLAKQFEAAIHGCNPKGARVTLDLETTFQEIVGVDVHVDSIEQSPASLRTLHDCVEAAVWDVEASFPSALEHDTMSFAF